MTITRAVHELKTWPQYFAAIRRGDKPFEIRKNDRDFQVGDTLILQEFDPELDRYTGETETRLITSLLSEEGFGVIHGFVVIGFGAARPADASAGGGSLTRDQLADWHALQSSNAAIRAKAAHALGDRFANPPPGRARQSVAADRQHAVAALGEEEASFHEQAARLVRDDYGIRLAGLRAFLATDAAQTVLGLPNFRTGPIAHVMRAGGAEIRTKCEAEQAWVIQWLLELVLEHGDGWGDVGQEQMAAARERAALGTPDLQAEHAAAEIAP
jgi:hypothetical protein